LVSLGCGVWVCYFDYKRDKTLGVEHQEVDEADKTKLSDIKNFGLSFWLLCVSCVLFSISVYPFINIASLYF
jgi:hypothetical protein